MDDPQVGRIIEALVKSAIDDGDHAVPPDLHIPRTFAKGFNIAHDARLPDPIKLIEGDEVGNPNQVTMLTLWKDQVYIKQYTPMILVLKDINGVVYERADMKWICGTGRADDPEAYQLFVVICGSDATSFGTCGRQASLVLTRTPLALAHHVYDSIHVRPATLDLDQESAWSIIRIGKPVDGGLDWAEERTLLAVRDFVSKSSKLSS